MFTEQSFSIPKLQGISPKTIEEHKKLYAGYVKNSNVVVEKIAAYRGDESKVYELGELYRHFAFEFNGMRNHEVYFSLLTETSNLAPESSLAIAISNHWKSIDVFIAAFSTLALTRGVGWAMLSWDHVSKELILHWIDEQHLGQLQGTTPIIALDMWEHSYVADYFPSGKKQYIEDFLSQMNWNQAQANFEAAVHRA